MATVNLSSIITPANVLTASNAETLTNKTINIASNTLTGVQPTLVSGTSIKTVNSTSLLGSGNISLSSGLTLLSTVTASAAATIDVETTFDATYDCYLIVGSNITTSGDSDINVRMKIGGTYLTTNYKYHYWAMDSESAAYSAGANDGSATNGIVLPNVGTASGSSGNFNMRVWAPSDTVNRKLVDWEATGIERTSFAVQKGGGACGNTGTAALTGIRFFAAGATTLTGKVRLYGIANS